MTRLKYSEVRDANTKYINMTLENYCAAGENGWEVVVKIVKLLKKNALKFSMLYMLYCSSYRGW